MPKNNNSHLQASIQIKNEKLADEMREFQESNYPHLKMVKLFEHALVQLMKREK